jgi:hypothetical protein
MEGQSSTVLVHNASLDQRAPQDKAELPIMPPHPSQFELFGGSELPQYVAEPSHAR